MEQYDKIYSLFMAFCQWTKKVSQMVILLGS